MTSYVTPKRATAFRFFVSLTSQANTKTFQSNPTLASGDAKVSKDGGALNNLTTLPSVIGSGKIVQIDLSATEMTADNVTVILSDASGAEWCDLTINIQTTARQIDDLLFAGSNPATTFASVDITGTLNILDGVYITRAISGIALTCQGQGTDGHGAAFKSGVAATGDGVRIESLADDGYGLNIIGTGDGAGIQAQGGGEGIFANGTVAGIGCGANGIVSNITGNLSGSVGSVTASNLLVRTTIATLASQTSFTLTAGSADNDAYNGAVIVIEDSATTNQRAVGFVSDYVGATRTVTLLADPGIFTMAVGDKITILGQSLSGTTVKLTADGLDNITTTAPAGVASNFREMIIQTWRRFFKKATETTSELKTYADNGTTVLTTQAVSDVAGTETQGPAT